MSQAPTQESDGIPDGYRNAWEVIRLLAVQKGYSFSGFERNHTFLNIGDGRFADVSMISSCDCEGDGRSVATVDWDDDGRLDLVLKSRTGPRLQFFQNRYPASRHYLVLELQGNGETTNRDAIGAIVSADLGDRVLRQTLLASDGFLAQSSKRVHLGLGDSESVRELTVAWPDGTESVFHDVPADLRLRIVQGEEVPLPLAARTIPAMARVLPRPLEADHEGISRAVLAFELPMSAAPLPGYDAPGRRVADLAGRTVLIDLWQTTCLPCRRELLEFRERADEIEKSGLRIVPINLDEEIDDEISRPIVARYDLAWDAGVRDDRFDRTLQIVYEEIFGERSNLKMPLPTSLLLDARGNLVVVYLGPVEVDQLLADVAELERDDPRPVLDRLSRGQRLVHPKRAFGALARRFEEAGLSDLADYYRDVDAKKRSYFIEGGERHFARDPGGGTR